TGEVGEYETLVFDAHKFKDYVSIIKTHNRWDGQSGYLIIEQASLQHKPANLGAAPFLDFREIQPGIFPVFHQNLAIYSCCIAVVAARRVDEVRNYRLFSVDRHHVGLFQIDEN